jgi:hypothetical protein
MEGAKRSAKEKTLQFHSKNVGIGEPEKATDFLMMADSLGGSLASSMVRQPRRASERMHWRNHQGRQGAVTVPVGN